MKKLLSCLLLLSMHMLTAMNTSSTITLSESSIVYIALDQTYWKWNEERGNFKNITKDSFINKSTAQEIAMPESTTDFRLSKEVRAPNKTRWQYLYNPYKVSGNWFRNELGDN